MTEYVMVPKVPTPEWIETVIWANQPHLSNTSKAWKEQLENLLHWHAAMIAVAPKPEQTDGYAYEYPFGQGSSVIRHNSGGNVNGADPIAVVPYYYGNPAIFERSMHTDDDAVDRFAHAMKAKLAKKRGEGRGGWENCPAETISKMLIDHVAKGDPVDVANFCMMLHQNGARIRMPEQDQKQVDIFGGAS